MKVVMRDQKKQMKCKYRCKDLERQKSMDICQHFWLLVTLQI